MPLPHIISRKYSNITAARDDYQKSLREVKAKITGMSDIESLNILFENSIPFNVMKLNRLNNYFNDRLVPLIYKHVKYTFKSSNFSDSLLLPHSDIPAVFNSDFHGFHFLPIHKDIFCAGLQDLFHKKLPWHRDITRDEFTAAEASALLDQFTNSTSLENYSKIFSQLQTRNNLVLYRDLSPIFARRNIYGIKHSSADQGIIKVQLSSIFTAEENVLEPRPQPAVSNTYREQSSGIPSSPPPSYRRLDPSPPPPYPYPEPENRRAVSTRITNAVAERQNNELQITRFTRS